MNDQILNVYGLRVMPEKPFFPQAAALQPQAAGTLTHLKSLASGLCSCLLVHLGHLPIQPRVGCIWRPLNLPLAPEHV